MTADDPELPGLEHARALVALLGREEVVRVLAQDEHPRYGLYKALLQCVTRAAPLHSWSTDQVPLHLEPELLSLILRDPDESMSRATVLDLVDWHAHALEGSEAFERWFESVRPEIAHIPYVVARGEGWILVKQVEEGVDVPMTAILEADGHVQEHLARSATSDEVLAALEEHGRSRATRHYARSRRRNKS